MKLREWLWLLLSPMGLMAQGGSTTCPYVRYILIDACTNSNEGNDEIVIFYTPIAFNINDLRIDFPNPAGTVWCYTSCGTNNFTCTGGNAPTVLSYLNSSACSGTNYLCPTAGTTIPANSWIILFTGTNVSANYPNPSNLCVGGTVYVLFANQSSTAGRFLNNPNNLTNRRLKVAFEGMPACSMTVNYRGSMASSNGNYLLVDPTTCIGLTGGENANNGSEPPVPNSCRYCGSGSGCTSNGVSLGNVGPNCALPGPGVLPITWQEVRVVGGRLRWRAIIEEERVGPVALWHQPSLESPPYRYRTELSPAGELPLTQTGLYYLTIAGANGVEIRSPSVWYEGEGGPYIRYEGQHALIERNEEIAALQVWDVHGRLRLAALGPVTREVLTPLTEQGAGVYIVSMQLRSGEARQERLILMP